MYTLRLVKFDENQCPKELFSKMTPQNLWLLLILAKTIPQNLFFAWKKAPQKMAHPVPAYMVVTPPPRVANT